MDNFMSHKKQVTVISDVLLSPFDNIQNVCNATTKPDVVEEVQHRDKRASKARLENAVIFKNLFFDLPNLKRKSDSRGEEQKRKRVKILCDNNSEKVFNYMTGTYESVKKEVGEEPIEDHIESKEEPSCEEIEVGEVQLKESPSDDYPNTDQSWVNQLEDFSVIDSVSSLSSTVSGDEISPSSVITDNSDENVNQLEEFSVIDNVSSLSPAVPSGEISPIADNSNRNLRGCASQERTDLLSNSVFSAGILKSYLTSSNLNNAISRNKLLQHSVNGNRNPYHSSILANSIRRELPNHSILKHLLTPNSPYMLERPGKMTQRSVQNPAYAANTLAKNSKTTQQIGYTNSSNSRPENGSPGNLQSSNRNKHLKPLRQTVLYNYLTSGKSNLNSTTKGQTNDLEPVLPLLNNPELQSESFSSPEAYQSNTSLLAAALRPDLFLPQSTIDITEPCLHINLKDMPTCRLCSHVAQAKKDLVSRVYNVQLTKGRGLKKPTTSHEYTMDDSSHYTTEFNKTALETSPINVQHEEILSNNTDDIDTCEQNIDFIDCSSNDSRLGAYNTAEDWNMKEENISGSQLFDLLTGSLCGKGSTTQQATARKESYYSNISKESELKFQHFDCRYLYDLM